MKHTCIIIVGPTAVGKTALAIDIAKHFSTEIISCDSRQCFKELNIGVAKPSPAQLEAVKHYFINSHSIHDAVNAAVFEQYALEKAKQIFSSGKVAVMVGGTGLYVKAFCEGMDEVPEISPSIRVTIIESYNQFGLSWLKEQVEKKDSKFFKTGEMQNPQRMMRALEVKLSTGRSIIDFQTKQKKARDFNIIKIGLEVPRHLLIERINKRVDIMMQEGLEEEVRALIPVKDLNALQTVGYRELFSYFNSEVSLSQAIESIKINTRQYAKRQMTWFKKNNEILWCDVNLQQVLDTISKQLHS